MAAKSVDRFAGVEDDIEHFNIATVRCNRSRRVQGMLMVCARQALYFLPGFTLIVTLIEPRARWLQITSLIIFRIGWQRTGHWSGQM